MWSEIVIFWGLLIFRKQRRSELIRSYDKQKGDKELLVLLMPRVDKSILKPRGQALVHPKRMNRYREILNMSHLVVEHFSQLL